MNQVSRKEFAQLFLSGTIIGMILFVAVYGYRIIDVTYDDWLYVGGDLSQHYLGWMYYRTSPWKFPFGLIEGLASTTSVSIVYMDSIPILACFFKLFSDILPDTFQYFGIWGIVSYSLMGGFSAFLIRRFTKNKFFCVISSAFFIVSPYVLQRMFSHTSLGGQWIIIVALVVWFYNPFRECCLKKAGLWTLVLCMAAAVHIYFIPMIVIFILCDSIYTYLQSKKILYSFIVFLCPVLSALLLLYALGAFIQGGSLSSDGLGFFSANLNTMFNPIFGISKIFQELPHGEGQYEGMGYLGAGILFIMILAGYLLLINSETWTKERRYLHPKSVLTFLACCAFLILALSPTVTYGVRVLFEIPWPDAILKLLGVFRSSGRFIWPLCYLTMVFFISTVIRYVKYSWSCLVLGLALLIQIYDLSGYMIEKRNQFSEKMEYVDIIQEDQWDLICRNKKTIVFIPDQMPFTNSEFTVALGKFMYGKGVTFNSFYMARMDQKAVSQATEKYVQEIGTPQANQNIYIFPNKQAIFCKDLDLFFYDMDGVIVGLNQSLYELEKNRIDPFQDLEIELDDMRFSGNGIKEGHRLYIFPDTLMYGPYYPIQSGTYTCTIKGKNINSGELEISSYKDEQVYSFKVLESADDERIVKFTIPKEIEDLEIKMHNINQNIIEIDSIVLAGE